MPRDAYLISADAIALSSILRAGVTVDETLTLRSLTGGAALQIVGDDYSAVATIMNSREVPEAEEIARLVPATADLLDSLDGLGGWLTEALVPWDADGEPGLSILRELAVLTRSVLIIEDGT